MSFKIVGAHADHFRFGPLEPRVELLKPSELVRSAAREGLGKEGQDDALGPEQLGEDQGILARRRRGKLGRALALVQKWHLREPPAIGDRIVDAVPSIYRSGGRTSNGTKRRCQ